MAVLPLALVVTACTQAPPSAPGPPTAPDTSAIGDVAAVELPPVDNIAGTRAWLTGEGAPATALVTATNGLWRTGATACTEVTGRLAAAGSPQAVLDAALATPDLGTAELLVDLHAALADLLRTCDAADDGDEFADRQSAFAWQWALAQRRLEEVGI